MSEFSRDILRELGKYPRGHERDAQLDQCVVDRCKDLAVKADLQPNDIKALLDDCACASLCSDFVMCLLDTAWRNSAVSP